MKKFFKRFLLFFCLPLVIFVAFVFGSTIYIRGYRQEHFDCEDHTEHFNISYNESEKSAIADIENQLENSYGRITTDLKQPMDKPVNIKIYPDLDSLHFSLKLNSGLFWWINIFGKMDPKVVGDTDTGSKEIKIVSPLNPGKSGYTYDMILSVAVHEFTHAVTLKLAPNDESINIGFGQFLQDGIAVYESNQGVEIENNPSFTNENILKVLPESIDEHSASDGYRYVTGYSFIKYVIDNYGYDKLIELLKKDYSGGNYDSETRQLYNEWVEYLKTNQN